MDKNLYLNNITFLVITPKKISWKPEKTIVKFHKMTSYTWNFQNFTRVFIVLVKFDIYFLRLPWEIAFSVIIRSPSLFFMNIFGKRNDLPFFTQERYHAWFRLRMSRMLFAAKHSWMTLRMIRPLFVGSYLKFTWWVFSQWKGRKICIEW